METTQADKRVDELEPGDVVLNIFDVEHVVKSVRPSGFTRPSKHTSEEVPVLIVKFVKRGSDSPWWNADRKVRVRS